MTTHGSPLQETGLLALPAGPTPRSDVTPVGRCPHCGLCLDDHVFRIDTLQVECPKDHDQRPLFEWLQPGTDLDAIPAFAHAHSTVLGTRFDSLDQDGVVSYIANAIAMGHGGWVVTPNVDILRQMASSAPLESLLNHATLLLVDGAPVEWAAHMSGQGSVHRTPGSSLMLPLAAAAEQHGIPMLLLGGRDHAGDLAAAGLREKYPRLDVRWHCPPLGFEHDERLWREVEDAVASCDGGIVMCGLGAPKQELVASRLLAAYPRTWFLGVGATIDFTAGMVSRAPAWMQRVGLEWLFRLAVEPRRLFHRYIVDDLPFVARLLSWAVRTRVGHLLSHGSRKAPDAKITSPHVSGEVPR